MIITDQHILDFVTITGDKNRFHQPQYMYQFKKRPLVPGLLLLSYAMETIDIDKLLRISSIDVEMGHPVSSGDDVEFNSEDDGLDSIIHAYSNEKDSLNSARIKYSRKSIEPPSMDYRWAGVQVNDLTHLMGFKDDAFSNMILSLGSASNSLGVGLTLHPETSELLKAGYRPTYRHLNYSLPKGMNLDAEDEFSNRVDIIATKRSVQGKLTSGDNYIMHFSLAFVSEKGIIKRYAKNL